MYFKLTRVAINRIEPITSHQCDGEKEWERTYEETVHSFKKNNKEENEKGRERNIN